MPCKIKILLERLKKAFPSTNPAIGFLATREEYTDIEWTLHADGKCYTFTSFKEVEDYVQRLIETYDYEQVLTFNQVVKGWGEGGESSELEVK